MKRIGIWNKDDSSSLEEELRRDWDLVLAESDDGKKIGLGDGYKIYFAKNPAEKIDFNKKLEKLNWAAWGYNAYLLTGVPVEVILRQLRDIFPEAVFRRCNECAVLA